MDLLEHLARRLTLGDLLDALKSAVGPYELIAHWKQGEFHHDVILRVEQTRRLPGPVLVVSTNCNGGVKEVLCLESLPERDALWHMRCPDGEFDAIPLPELLGVARTTHYFDPCELLAPDARSELRPEHRRRQRGGGWEPAF